MKLDEKPYYQTTVSNIKFYAEAPDPDDFSLEDHRANEVTQLRTFIEDSTTRVLVVGGISATGKTYLLKKHAPNFDYLGSFTHLPIREHYENPNQSIVKRIPAMIRSKAEKGVGEDKNDRSLVLDEGLLLSNDKWRPFAGAIIEGLLEHFEKLIIAGGGDKYTSDEQTELLSSLIPGSIDFDTVTFLLQELNEAQLTQIIQIKNGVEAEVAAVLASTIISYFRLARIGRRSLYKDPKEIGVLKEGFMPQDVYSVMWERQQAKWRELGMI